MVIKKTGYSFKLVLRNSVDLNDCAKLLEQIFNYKFFPQNIQCNWCPILLHGQYVIEGTFEAIGKIQHDFRSKFDNNSCSHNIIIHVADDCTSITRITPRHRNHPKI